MRRVRVFSTLLSKNQAHCVRAYRSGLLIESVSGFPESKLNPFFEKTGRLKYSGEWKGHKFSYNFNVIKESFITENFSKSKQKDQTLGISIAIHLH